MPLVKDLAALLALALAVAAAPVWLEGLAPDPPPVRALPAPKETDNGQRL